MGDDRCDLLCLDLPLAEAVREELAGSQAEHESAAARAKALADPTRLTVARALAAAEELCVCDVAWIVGRDERLVSHHLRLLRTGGLAISRREGKMVFYAITPVGRELLDAVLAVDVVR